MRRKKQGASLIVVIIIFMFLTTVSVAMMSMILGNYKARVSESKRVENLYASDSGLDVAYNIIGKTFDAAVKYGYYEVKALKSSSGNNYSPNNDKYKTLESDITKLNAHIATLKGTPSSATLSQKDINNSIEKDRALIQESETMEQLLINEEFKRTFKNFIKATSDKGTGEIPPDKLADSITNHKYVNVSFNTTDGIKLSEESINFGIDTNGTAPTLTIDPFYATNVSGSSIEKGIKQADGGHFETVDFYVSPDQEYNNVKVTSIFYSEKLKSNDDGSSKTNERRLQASFKLTVPNFDDMYYQEANGAVQQYLATKDRAITVNGNMNLNDADGFEVKGEIYVGGTIPTVDVDNRSYAKYSGGIMVYNSSSVNSPSIIFNNDVITRSTLNLRNNADVTVKGNFYGKNVYIGGSTYNPDPSKLSDGLSSMASGVNLNVGQVIIDNDLGLKAEKSTVTINDFFGVNDKNISKTGNPVDANGKPVDRTKSSSSILVNSTDGSPISIINSAYIMGTAHINTNETNTNSSNEYQTGESGAIKGNYIAYTVPVDQVPPEKFAYYNPLQLLDEPDVVTKAAHFEKYWENESKKSHYPDAGGIQWPHNDDGSIKNTHTAGALVYEINGTKKALGSTYNLDTDLQDPNSVVYKKQSKFASKVYKFNESATKKYDYDYDVETDFTSLVRTDQISSLVYNLSNQTNNGEYAILNGDSSKQIRITRSNNNVDSIVTNTNTIEIQVGNKGTVSKPEYTLNAVIVTAGNVSIDSDPNITINGCVIVQGDFNINGQKGIKINYDSGVIERVQAKNPAAFKAVFGQYVVDDSDIKIVTNNDTADGVNAASYDLKKYLQKILWQIKK